MLNGTKSVSRRFLKKKYTLAFALLASCSFCQNSWAGIGVEGSLGYIKNPQNDSHSDPGSDAEEMLTTLTVNGDFHRETQRFITSLDYNAGIYKYKNALLEDREILVGNGLLRWILRPDSIIWDLSNSRTDVLRTSTRPDVSDNKEVVSITSTGPKMAFQFGPNDFSMDADYSVAVYSRSEYNDQNRASVNLSLGRLVTQGLRASMNASALDVAFDSDLQVDYEIFSVSGKLVYNSSNYSLSLEKGEYETHRGSLPVVSSPLLNFNGNYSFNPSSSVNFSYSESVEDPVSNISNSLDDEDGTGVPPEGTVNANIFEQIQKAVSYVYTEEERYSLMLTYSHNKKNYQVGRHEISEMYRVNFSVPLTPALNMSIFASYAESLFSLNQRSHERVNTGLNMDYLLNSSFGLNFSVSYVEQTGNLRFDNYDGLNAVIGFRYSR